MRATRRLAGLLTAASAALAALVGTAAAPAQAYSPDPDVKAIYRDTDYCPCSLSDPFDGTYFAHDAGGYAVKLELRENGWYVGKVEFHPYGEKLWVYDTKNDGDTFYVHVTYSYDGTTHNLGTYHAPGTSAVVDKTVKDFSIPEGAYVDISVYDDSALTDYIGGARGTGAAIA
ncbi:hypothetical protein [Streptomyces beihaiensis]|uniref:Secreted protein n=1 Tax=Streptomyces beihaiensis TaxID=2984495 RepID=A0ABT3TT85_9ACTN|nr:hypothetical protein [Streptomyces beihaiensis]MCX3060254.1 hypothetical protein [Streptomyces beihaiensis]